MDGRGVRVVQAGKLGVRKVEELVIEGKSEIEME
jgi:hypothetical protein